VTSLAILIPARWGSTRFEGKPLAELNGVPLIKRVYDICKSTGIDTYVLTDDQRIYNVIGPDCIIDQDNYENGTERCRGAHVKSFVSYDRYINVQGDMADVNKEIIQAAIDGLEHAEVSTVFTLMPVTKQNDPSTVKMVRSDKHALWFGRGMTGYGDWHLGVYGYTASALEQYPKQASLEEEVEKLEQLRWLKNGWQISTLGVYYNGLEINTPEDLEEWHNKNSQ